MESLLSPSRIARLFSVHRSTVSRWIEEGKVFNSEVITYINDKPRVPISEVNRVIKAGKIKI